MIARLKGILDTVGADQVIIDVGGIGYQVAVSSRTLAALGGAGAEVTLHTQMLVGDDFIRLVGFATAFERDWFMLLVSVQGVGARVALAILSALTVEEVAGAVARGDSASIARAQGVGPKLAQRVVNELKDKASPVSGPLPAGSPRGSISNEAVSALTNLGFRNAEASAAVARAHEELGDGASLDALVRAALRKAAR
jgi:Holliday junction DNA helicase RuvA